MGVYPKSIIEVISDVHLRSHFGLKDGDRVKIELDERAWNG